MINPQDWRRLIRPLVSMIRGVLSRGVAKMVNDEPRMQELQVGMLAGELRDRLEHPQPYGFSSVPHDDAECFVGFLNGSRDHGVVLVADDRRYRVKGRPQGEVSIYTDEGDEIRLRRGRIIEVTTDRFEVNAGQGQLVVDTNGCSLTFDSAQVTMDGTGVTVTGDTTIVEGNDLVRVDAGGAKFEAAATGKAVEIAGTTVDINKV